MAIENVYIIIHRYLDEYQETVTEIVRVCSSLAEARRYIENNYNLPASGVDDATHWKFDVYGGEEDIWIQMEIVY